MSKVIRAFVVAIIGFFGTFAALIYFLGGSSTTASVSAPDPAPAGAETSPPSEEPSAINPAPDPAPAPAPKDDTPPDPCIHNWRSCPSLDALIDRYDKIIDARLQCRDEANHRARYGDPKWPGFWDGGPFTHYSTTDDFKKTGVIHLVETDSQFQNEFGAMAHMEVICTYNLQSSKVSDIQILEK